MLSLANSVCCTDKELCTDEDPQRRTDQVDVSTTTSHFQREGAHLWGGEPQIQQVINLMLDVFLR